MEWKSRGQIWQVLRLASFAGLLVLAQPALASPLSSPAAGRGAIADVLINVTTLPNGESAINVGLSASHKQISAIFENATGDRIWERLWFSRGINSLSAPEQAVLRLKLDALEREAPVELSGDNLARAKAMIDFLANFLPTDEALKPFDRRVSRIGGVFRSALNLLRGSHYSPICDAIGTLREATFTTTDKQVVTRLIAVGAQDTRCRGRCGMGCTQHGQWRGNQYTQECLNHDLCHDTTGFKLGPCEDMFWKAAPSYLFAPDCAQAPISIGPREPVATPIEPD